MAASDFHFPFSAVIGQDDYKLALLACAVDPAIGGVLAVGDRGTAKSTLARSFADLLPAGPDAERGRFVELPLGATIDRLTGSVDTAKLLAGEGAQVTPGLLAAADGGVLYADEVNLLGDHLVDLLLDAAAFGRVLVERDGISETHAARFVLVGTMNPEEGELRPQLLDRFGLSVWIETPTQTSERTAIVTRRIAFERDRAAFCDRFSGTQQALAQIVCDARSQLPAVSVPDETLAQISELCVRLGVEGMRGDIVTARTAAALAALDGRAQIDERDVATAARLALAHRARSSSESAGRISSESIDELLTAIRICADSGSAQDGALENGGAAHPSGAVRQNGSIQQHDAVARRSTGTAARTARRDDHLRESSPRRPVTPQRPAGFNRESAATAAADDQPAAPPAATPAGEGAAPRESRPRELPSLSPPAGERGGALGRGSRTTGVQQPAVDSARPARIDANLDLDPIATARAAVTRRLVTGSPAAISTEDLRERVRAGREANLVLCVVDASSSVLENGRAGELRTLLAGLVGDARRKRDRVGLIVFSGRSAKLVAPPSRNHAAVLGALDRVEPGGTTPLAEGIRVAHQEALRELRRSPELRPVVALLTDGYANISQSGDAIGEARAAARLLRRDKISLIVIGESSSGAPSFARSTGAEFYAFDPPGERRVA